MGAGGAQPLWTMMQTTASSGMRRPWGQEVPAEQRGPAGPTDLTCAVPALLQAPRPPSPVLVPVTQRVQVNLALGPVEKTIPQSFFGFSHEWGEGCFMSLQTLHSMRAPRAGACISACARAHGHEICNWGRTRNGAARVVCSLHPPSHRGPGRVVRPADAHAGWGAPRACDCVFQS